jgi:hypothetical protein
MSLRKYPRNSDCPCGSGKKYKRCHGSHHIVSNDRGDFTTSGPAPDDVRVPIDDAVIEHLVREGWDLESILFLKGKGCQYSVSNGQIVLPAATS